MSHPFEKYFFVFLHQKVKYYIIFILLLLVGLQSFGQNNPCTQYSSYHIVVLGSSTAAGAGASTADSAWVNRYRTYLQSINPGNEVTNLAVGGFTSYRLMPDDYTPPASRPDPDTSHNIDAALELNPDAIIINLPSNDIASGFSLNEQLHNLDTILEIATTAGVPVWITTTQPRNMSVANMQLQEDMKDSMYIHYSPHVIDFWTTAAMPDNSMNPIYDSGDGVHQNDSGHALMCERVIENYIPDSLYSSPTIPEYGIFGLSASQQSVCGDSAAQIELQAVNFGINDFATVQVVLEIQNINTAQIVNDTLLIYNGVNTCQSDTQYYSFSTYEFGNYKISGNVFHSSDTVLTNNSDTIEINSIGHPEAITITDDTLCEGGFATLDCIAEMNDHEYWYNAPAGGLPIDSGFVFHTLVLSGTTSYYPQIIRGHLFFADSLLTQENSNVNWNGCMFNLVAHEDIIIDSLGIKINSTGYQGIQMHIRQGAYEGYENDPFAWSLYKEDTVFVNNSSDFKAIDAGSLNMNTGDTIGVYLQMMNSSATLSYYNSGSGQTKSNSELSIITGSGISHNFGSVFSPRNWCGQMYYHYGYRPQGDCVSERYEAIAHVNELDFSIGNDTIIDILDEIDLFGPGGMNSYLWSDNSTSQNIHLRADSLGEGIHFIWLSVSDSLSCVFKDSLILGVADLAGLEEMNSELYVYPNPFSKEIHLKSDLNISSATLISVEGKETVLSMKHERGETVLMTNEDLSPGIYVLQLNSKDKNTKILRIIKE